MWEIVLLRLGEDFVCYVDFCEVMRCGVGEMGKLGIAGISVSMQF